MAKIARGDQEAFRALVERYQPSLLNLAYRFCGDRHRSEDLVQEIFLKVYLHAGRWRPEADLSAWLHRVAVNHCLNDRRARRGRTIPYQDSVDWNRGAAPAGPRANPSPEAELQDKERALELQAAILSLPARQRMAVILQRYHDLTYRQIADRMGCSEGAVESLLVRAYRGLRRRLSKGGC